MPTKILGNPQGRLTKKVQDTLLAKGITSEIINPDVLEPTEGWRTNGAVDYRTDYEAHNQMLPLIYIDGVCYNFAQAMEKFGPKDVEWKVWTPSPVVCSKVIAVAIKDDVIQEVIMEGSCMGFSNALNILVKGMEISRVVQLLQNVPCQTRGTSCPQELSKGLRNG